jgi:hypothetical protein
LEDVRRGGFLKVPIGRLQGGFCIPLGAFFISLLNSKIKQFFKRNPYSFRKGGTYGKGNESERVLEGNGSYRCPIFGR